MSSLSEELRQEYTIETPESVSFGYDVAGVGSRLIGALIDLAIVAALLVFLNLALWVLIVAVGDGAVLFLGLDSGASWLTGLIVASYALFEFSIIWGYFLLFELLWNGQSPGKRVAGTRVVRLDGEPAGFSEAAIRNLVRFVDFLPSLYAVGFVTMLFNDKSRRLGDFAAGTLVVREQSVLRLADLTQPARTPTEMEEAASPSSPPDPPVENGIDLRQISHDDYALIREALDREAAGRLEPATLTRLAAAFARRLQAPALPHGLAESRAWLAQIAEDWERRPAPGGD